MIAVRPVDRVYLRFVWPNQDGEVVTWRIKRVPFGVNCSPFLLNATIRHHLQLEKQNSASEEVRKIVELMQDSFYVDDCLSRLSVREQVDEFQMTSCEIIHNASMELRKRRGNGIKSSEDAGTKVLGLTWDFELDCLSLSAEFTYYKQWTRRTLLKLLASIFDPLGFITPFTIAGKKLLQQSWKESKDWDTPFNGILEDQTSKWAEQLPLISSFHIMRWIGAVEGEKYCLHLFTDASEAAYACCLYLCHANKSCLLFSKGKVAPLKTCTMTIARLELQAAFLGARCVEFVCNELRINTMKIFAWTDSITTWHWLQKPAHSWTSWVANRVSAIQEISDGLNITWKHCEGARNPADLPSRGEISLEVLKDWHLRQTWFVNECEWPTDRVPGPTEDVLNTNKVHVVSANAVLTENAWWSRLSTCMDMACWSWS